jgi:hypothetical protein
MLTFEGSLDDLQDIVMRCAILGEWSFHKNSYFYRFRTSTGVASGKRLEFGVARSPVI